MAIVGVVKAIITADTTQLKKGMTDAQRSMDQLGKNMTKVGKSMTMKVTMPLVGIGVAAAKMASDFEYSMTQIETLVGRTAQEVETLKGSVLGLSGETGRAPKELADAMFFITSAGLDAASATAALEYSAKAAAVGLGDTVVVADAVTNAMNGYGMSAEGAAYATDVLAKTVEQGKASAADLAPQFGRLIPMAAELGISFDQVGGGLAFLTRASGDAALSATQLSGVMKSFLKPSQMAKKVLEEIGVDLHELRAAASTDLLGALQGLREKLEANGLEMSNVFEDIRGLNGALQLTGVATGAARVVFDELADSTGKLDEAFLGVQKTAQFKMSQAMSAMKASMITLGEAILPVVVPMLQGLAAVIGKLGGWFGSLSGAMKTTIVVIGVIVAAIGPLLMVVGSVTSALVTLGIVGAGVTVSLSAILVPLAAIVAIGAIVFTLFNRWSNAAKEAAGRQQLLTDQLRDMNDPATTMVSRIDELVEANTRLKKAIDDSAEANTKGEEAAKEFYAQQVLMKELVGRDVVGAYDKLSLSSGLLEAAIKSGTDAFDREANIIRALSGHASERQAALHGESQAVENLTEAVRAKVDAGTISLAQGVAILQSIGDTAEAHKDHTQKLENDAKAYLNAEGQGQKFIDLLGVETYESVKAAGAGKSHMEQLELLDAAVLTAATRIQVQNHRLREAAAHNDMVNAALARRRAEEKRLAASAALADIAMMNSARSMQNLTDEEVAASIAAYGLRLRVDEMNTAIAAGEDPLGRMAEQLAEITAQAEGADRALLIVAGGADAEGRMSRAAHWEGQMVLRKEEQLNAARAIAAEEARQEQLIRDAERALQDQKDALQANIYVQEEALENAEAHLAALEAQAEAAKKPVQALKDRAAAEREGFDALRGMWQAQNDLNDAIETQQSLVDEIALVIAGEGDAIAEATKAWEEQKAVVQDLADEMEDLNDQILDAEARKLDLLAKEGEFQRGLTRELNAQKLAYFDINAQVAELEGRQAELSEGALDTQRGLVDSLKAQQAAITEVEQALIDLGIVSAADAAQANISAKQAKNLIKLRDEMEDTQAAFEAGEATTLDLIEAQDDYTKAVKDARRPIDQLERATDDLARMEKDAERIGLELAVARDKLTQSTEAKAKAEDTAARTSEAVAEIDAELISLEEKLAEVTKAETEARDEANKMKDMSAIQDAELVRLNKELEVANWDLVAAQYGVRDAEIALAEAGDKVNDAISRMRPLSEELADEMEVLSDVARLTYPEFDTMRATLAVLEPQIASAKSAVDGFKDAIAALVREMAILNGTRINPIEVPNAPPLTGQPSGGGGGGSPAAAAIVAAVDEVAAAVAEVVTAVDAVAETGGALLDGDEFKALINATVNDNADAILGIQEAAALEKFLGNISAYDIPEMPVYMPKVATPSTYGSIGGPGSRGGGFPSAAAGGFVQSAGLVNVHAGETITPRGGGVNIVVNVEGSVSSERDLVESIRKGLLQAQKSGKAVVL